MTGQCSKNITPDGLTGMIMALEGIKDTIVLLNGPMGCKFYHSTTSQFITVRPPLYLPSDDGKERVPVNYNFINSWFFRQSRVPCTWLDGDDYVYGTSEKVEMALCYIEEHVDFKLMAIVNSPGASLIGDNLHELINKILPEKACIMLESPGYSTDFSTGYSTAFVEVIRQLGDRLWKKSLNGDVEKEKAEGESTIPDGHPISVNLLGISLWQRYWEGDVRELTRLFELCDIRVNCVPFGDCTLEELKNLPTGDLNVVLYPEMAAQGAEFLKKWYGIPCYICPGLPIGFDSVERIFTEICEILGKDVTRLLEDSGKARALAWYQLDGVHQLCGMPNGVHYSVEGSVSQVYALEKFLTGYLGMIPDCLAVVDGENDRHFEDILEISPGRDMLDIRSELVFAEANTIAALKTKEFPFTGIEINRPGMGYIDLILKTQMGIQGTLFLIEQVLNGLMNRL